MINIFLMLSLVVSKADGTSSNCADPSKSNKHVLFSTEAATCIDCKFQEDKTSNVVLAAKHFSEDAVDVAIKARDLEFFKSYCSNIVPCPYTKTSLVVRIADLKNSITSEELLLQKNSDKMSSNSPVAIVIQNDVTEKKEVLERAKKALNNIGLDQGFETFESPDATVNFLKSEGCGLTFAEYSAINSYTGGGYVCVNALLRNSSEPCHDFYSANQIKLFVEVLNSGLKKLKDRNEMVSRGVDLPPKALEKHFVGAEVTYAAYTSTGISHKFKGDVNFVIKSRHGKYIDSYSANQRENEVLFLPDTKFKVLDKKVEGNIIIITMEEVN